MNLETITILSLLAILACLVRTLWTVKKRNDELRQENTELRWDNERWRVLHKLDTYVNDSALKLTKESIHALQTHLDPTSPEADQILSKINDGLKSMIAAAKRDAEFLEKRFDPKAVE